MLAFWVINAFVTLDAANLLTDDDQTYVRSSDKM